MTSSGLLEQIWWMGWPFWIKGEIKESMARILSSEIQIPEQDSERRVSYSFWEARGE